MRVLVVGASGQLGRELMKAFADTNPVGVDHALVDVEHPIAFATALRRHAPDLVINTAAFHNVELCETRPDRAFAVNALAVDACAAQCANAGISFAHVSTDYVFDGSATEPYDETAPARPINAYGISKYAGELLVARSAPRHYIFRTSGLYGIAGSSTKGYTFVERILTQAEAGKPLRVVDDVTFSPSYAPHVAATIRRVVESERFGTYHVTNAGACTWYEFATEALRCAGIAADVTAVTQATFPSIANRPPYSALANDAVAELGIEPAPPWTVGVAAYLAERIEKAAGTLDGYSGR